MRIDGVPLFKLFFRRITKDTYFLIKSKRITSRSSRWEKDGSPDSMTIIVLKTEVTFSYEVFR